MVWSERTVWICKLDFNYNNLHRIFFNGTTVNLFKFMLQDLMATCRQYAKGCLTWTSARMVPKASSPSGGMWKTTCAHLIHLDIVQKIQIPPKIPPCALRQPANRCVLKILLRRHCLFWKQKWHLWFLPSDLQILTVS